MGELNERRLYIIILLNIKNLGLGKYPRLRFGEAFSRSDDPAEGHHSM
jgi:hypothetical protein